MKIENNQIDGAHCSEHPEVIKAAARADSLAQQRDEPYAVWARPGSASCFVVPDDSDNRIQGCVMYYSTADGWL